jgi:hypothetical protein
MDKAYGTYSVEDTCWKGFGGRNLQERDNFENLDICGKDNIKMDHKETSWHGMEWQCGLEQEQMVGAFVNTVMNIRFQ